MHNYLLNQVLVPFCFFFLFFTCKEKEQLFLKKNEALHAFRRHSYWGVHWRDLGREEVGVLQNTVFLFCWVCAAGQAMSWGQAADGEHHAMAESPTVPRDSCEGSLRVSPCSKSCDQQRPWSTPTLRCQSQGPTCQHTWCACSGRAQFCPVITPVASPARRPRTRHTKEEPPALLTVCSW